MKNERESRVLREKQRLHILYLENVGRRNDTNISYKVEFRRQRTRETEEIKYKNVGEEREKQELRKMRWWGG